MRLALVVFLLPLPLPLTVGRPGAALPVADHVRSPTVEQDPVSGQLLLTTISLDEATPAEVLTDGYTCSSRVGRGSSPR